MGIAIKVVQCGEKLLESGQIVFLNGSRKSVDKSGIIPMSCLVSVLKHF